MAGKIHHVGVNSANFEQTVRFFQEVFQMEVARTRGDAPNRQLWFRQGIQVNESAEPITAPGVCDHIGIGVTNKEEVLAMVPSYGCKIFPNKSHWFTTPEGYVIELKEIV